MSGGKLKVNAVFEEGTCMNRCPMAFLPNSSAVNKPQDSVAAPFGAGKNTFVIHTDI